MKRKHLTLCMCVFECYRSCDSSSVGCYQCMCARMRLLTSLKNITNRMHVCITRVEHTAKGCQRGTTLRALRRHCLSHHMAWLVGKKNNNKIIHRCGRLPGRQCFHVIIITNIHCIVMCVCVPRFVCVVVLWVYVEEACWRFACWASPAHQPTTSLCMWRSLHIACCSVERFTWCVRSSSFLFLCFGEFRYCRRCIWRHVVAAGVRHTAVVDFTDGMDSHWLSQLFYWRQPRGMGRWGVGSMARTAHNERFFYICSGDFFFTNCVRRNTLRKRPRKGKPFVQLSRQWLSISVRCVQCTGGIYSYCIGPRAGHCSVLRAGVATTNIVSTLPHAALFILFIIWLAENIPFRRGLLPIPPLRNVHQLLYIWLEWNHIAACYGCTHFVKPKTTNTK